jgi:hypothetical protein
MTGRKRIQTPGVDVDPRSSNIVAIGAALDNPMDAPMIANEGDAAPFGGRDHDDGLDRPRLPRDCPVKPLGMGIDGRTYWYLNVLGQIVCFGGRDHGKNDLYGLFSPETHLLSKYWPRWSAPKLDRATGEVLVASKIVGFDQDAAGQALITRCGEVGIFDAQDKVRGRGAHRGRGNALILHVGDGVMMTALRVDGSAGKKVNWYDPGVNDKLGAHVYPAAAAVPRPWLDPVSIDAGEALLAHLSTCSWKRPELDTQLAMGWVAQAFICGALDWRSHIFVTGGAGTGKSFLNGKSKLFDRLFSGALMRSADATAAAIRQTLGGQTIPVMFDEFEAGEIASRAKVNAVIELARIASSGDTSNRGGSDHKAHQFTLSSCFMWSAILIPPMKPADKSRLAILELMPRPSRGDDEEDTNWEALKLPELGRKLQRRMIDGWPRLSATLNLYKAALGRVGHSPRGCDTFGTLLACADLLLFDGLPDEATTRAWAIKCAPAGLNEITETAAEHEACIGHLMTSMVQSRGGDDRETLGSWVGQAVDYDSDADGKSVKVRRRLRELGMAVVNKVLKPAEGELPDRWGAADYMHGKPGYLAVALSHRALGELFKETRWVDGGWAQALAYAPGSVRGIKVKMAHQSCTTVFVPLEHVIDGTDIKGFVTLDAETPADDEPAGDFRGRGA